MPEENNQEIDGIIEGLNDSGENGVDLTFVRQCRQILQTIQTIRRKLGFNPYSQDEKLMLIHEMYYDRFLHRDHMRGTGENYFAHLFGAALNIVRDMHITGLPSIVATLKHDDKEDIPGIKEGKIPLMSTHNYEHLLEMPKSEIDKICLDVSRMVDGATKVKLETREETRAATLLKLLKTIMAYGVKTAYVKLADRSDNMTTLHGLIETKGIERAMEIIRETYNIYIPLAHLLKLSTTEERLLAECVIYVNPTLAKDFDILVQSKMEQYCAPYESDIKAQFESLQWEETEGETIKSITFEPHSLSSVINRHRITKPLEEITLEDLAIDEMDPMFDIEIIIRSEEAYEESSKKIRAIYSHISSKFWIDEHDAIHRQVLSSGRGMLVSVFSKKYGGRLSFRINDEKSEARSRRGVMAEDKDAAPPHILEGIRSIIARLEANPSLDLFDVTDEDLLRGTDIFFSMKNHPFELPRGATPLDFARAVHSDLLIGVQGAWVAENVFGKRKHYISPFEELPPGHFVKVNSCTQRGKVNLSVVKAAPEWLNFCQPGTREVIILHLKKLTPKKKEALGKQYIKTFCELFSVSHEQIEETFIDDEGIHIRNKKQHFYRSLGSGALNLYDKGADLFHMNYTWIIHVTLKHQSGAFEDFTKEFKKYGINIEDINVFNARAKYGKTLGGKAQEKGTIIKVNLNESPSAIRNFMKLMLRKQLEGYSAICAPYIIEEEK